MQPATGKAHARVGLLGNPSDGYEGQAIAVSRVPVVHEDVCARRDLRYARHGPRNLVVVGAANAHRVLQLIAHGRGALHFGASEGEVSEAIYCALERQEEVRKVMAKIRRIGSG